MHTVIKLFFILLITNLYSSPEVLNNNAQFGLNYFLKENIVIILELILLLLTIAFILIYRQYSVKKINKKLNERIEKEIEKSREKDKMLFEQSKFISMGEMMENIAHQWRQPLSQINSSVLVIDDILYEKKFKDSVIEEKLLEIESLTKYMSNTIDDFKDFFEQNKESKKFSLYELIEESIYVVKGTYKTNNIEIINNINNQYTFKGYPSELEQVIVVILNNAKDMFISRKILNPKVKIDATISSGNYHISICDNAGGIKKEIINKIFNPYFTTKHKSQGTGLGLYLSKKIIEESMQGKLKVDTNKYGACFTITLNLDGVSDEY